jgi:hypothetical protein
MTPTNAMAFGRGPLLRQYDDVPVLQAYAPVTRKPGAIDLLSTSRGEPLLTIWPAGLGRTAMFAADLDGQWTRGWLTWRGLGAFLGTIVRSLAPRRLPPRALEVTPGDRQGPLRALEVTLEARDPEGHAANLLSPVVDVRGPTGALGGLELLQVAPGRYAARVVADVTEPLTFALAEVNAGPSGTRILAVDHAAEYRFGVPDARRLEALAHATGGTADATVEDLQAVARTAATVRRPIAPWLLLGALAAWLIDIGARRLARGRQVAIALFRSES